MSNKDTTQMEYRKQYYRDNLEKKREDARKYYHRNKEVEDSYQESRRTRREIKNRGCNC